MVKGLRASFERSLMASTCSAGFSRRYPSVRALKEHSHNFDVSVYGVGPESLRQLITKPRDVASGQISQIPVCPLS